MESLVQSRWLLSLLLALHAGLLAWAAARHTPTIDEAAHFATGVYNWEFGRFDLYPVNPPLVRMIATIPAVLSGVETDWRKLSFDPASRSEFSLAKDILWANGASSIDLVIWGRWLCIPFSLAGGLVCYCWASELYGRKAGLIALTLWCFCPTMIGVGAMILPDAPATALGVAAAYCFWQWLRERTVPNALLAGLLLGFAELCKFTWPSAISGDRDGEHTRCGRFV